MISNEKLPSSFAVFSPKKQLAFALLISERMLPSLIAFSRDTGFDDSCYLRARDAIWAALQKNGVDQALKQACIREAPDTEEFSHDLTSYALNAALAISDMVEFVLDGQTDHIACVASLARESVYLYLSALEPSIVSSPVEDSRIARHSLMQQEQRQQDEDVKFLSGLPDQFDGNTVSIIRERAARQAPLLPSINN